MSSSWARNAASILLFASVLGCGGGSDPEDAGVDAGSEDCTVDGTPCGDDGTCMGGECVEGRCGDEIVQAPEQCDDGNDTAFDGCESDCRFTCEDASDCLDANPCNGEETCPTESHVCTLGEPPTVGSTCTTAAIADGVCNATETCVPVGCGNGVVNGEEECDDGNTTPDDGCEVDCTFTCTEDADCIDALFCNGMETCNVADHTCLDAADPTCTPSDDCHTSTCSDEAAMCVEALIDGDGDGEAATSLGACGTDCADSDPERKSGNQELCGNAIDDDCNAGTSDAAMTLFYPDCDGDDFTPMGSSGIAACMEPASCGGCGCTTQAGTSQANSDCADNNINARPGQTAYFTTAISGVSSSRDYDYNCDTAETKRYTCENVSATAGCSSFRGGCLEILCLPGQPCCRDGWTGSAPACGASGTWSYCADTGTSCVRRTRTQTQSCH
jgi:cysteine-rich repeat protein